MTSSCPALGWGEELLTRKPGKAREQPEWQPEAEGYEIHNLIDIY